MLVICSIIVNINMELLIFILVGIPLIFIGAHLEDKRRKRKNDGIQTLIQQELNKRNFKGTNCIWENYIYVATDLQKDEIIIIKYDIDNCKLLDVRSINFHTTVFLSNGVKINGDYCFIYPRNATLIYLDNDAKSMLILSLDDLDHPKRLKYSDILSVELILDSHVISKKSLTDTIGRSIIGGAIAGNAGAIIGGTTSKSSTQDICKLIQCVLTIRNIQEPMISINLCDCKEGIKDVKNSDEYKQALLLMNTFSAIIDSCSQITKEADTSISSELTNLVQLKEKNILTEEEFIALKQKIINKKD